ncbi:hypothetical protein FPV67DRAFT_1416901 [Lyophyllum atratum]|nr:hypothetical protein FPV67DRAFT_1416901 [Lyophyllum atratum]
MKSANSSTVVPMRGTVLSSLAMAWAWGVIAGSVGLNALIKSNQEKSRLRKGVPPPTVVTINTNDVFKSGVILTVVAALIAVLCSIFILMAVFTRGLAARSLRIQAAILAFCAVWLFATLVPFTVFFANRSAQVSARVGNIELPPQIIKQAEQAMGSTSVYRQIGYLRLVAILPWITLLFTIIAAVVLFMAGSPARRVHAAPGHTTARDIHFDDDTVEKPAASTSKSAV